MSQREKETKNNPLSNPLYCLGCNKQYKERPSDIGSKYIDEYCRYLGFCDVKCWDKLPQYEKHDIAEIALLKGSTMKIRHKYYLENIKGYK